MLLVHSLTYLLTHLLSHSTTHSLTYSLTHLNRMEFVRQDEILLYVGALTDAFPITLPSVRRRYSTIIFTDGMPGSRYYGHKTVDSEQKILELLKTEGGAAAMVSEITYNDIDGSYGCQLKDNCSLKYFFNMDNIDVTKIPKELFGKIRALWMHGYVPPMEEIQKLSDCGDIALYLSPECMDNIHELAPLFKEINIIPSILQWDSSFIVAPVLEDSQYSFLNECEAPYSVMEDLSDDDEDQ